MRYNWGYIEVNAFMSKRKIEEYYKFDPTDANLWRTINLFGVNTASYKFALAKSLLKLGIENKT